MVQIKFLGEQLFVNEKNYQHNAIVIFPFIIFINYN